MYRADSLKAEEFMDDGEILDTLEYAHRNKNNVGLIDEILAKARKKRTVPQGGNGASRL